MKQLTVALSLCGLVLALCSGAFAADGSALNDIIAPDRGAGVTCVPVPSVPEPGSLVALASGVGGLGFFALRKRRG